MVVTKEISIILLQIRNHIVLKKLAEQEEELEVYHMGGWKESGVATRVWECSNQKHQQNQWSLKDKSSCVLQIELRAIWWEGRADGRE